MLHIHTLTTLYRRLRRLPLPRPDLPFAQDDAGRFLPWIIACMVCLTALLLAAALSVNHAMVENHSTYRHTLTLHILDMADDKTTAKNTQAALELLAQTPGIRDIVLLEETQLQQLISPWLGDNTALDLLPIPTVIEAQFDRKKTDLNALRTALQENAPAADLQEPQGWVERFSSFNHAIRLAALGLALLLLANTLGMVALASKTALKLHQHIVILLHGIGAKDHYIARQFQLNACLLTLKGAGIGTLTAMVIFSLFSWLTEGMEAPLLPELAWSWWHIITLTTLPFITAGIAWYVARRTVLKLLEAMP